MTREIKFSLECNKIQKGFRDFNYNVVIWIAHQYLECMYVVFGDFTLVSCNNYRAHFSNADDYIIGMPIQMYFGAVIHSFFGISIKINVYEKGRVKKSNKMNEKRPKIESERIVIALALNERQWTLTEYA